MSAWLLHHLQSVLFSLGKIYRAPLATLMTVAVIAITLTLPTGFFLMLKNIHKLTDNLSTSKTISLYLKLEVTDQQVNQLKNELQNREEFLTVQHITKEEALNRFKQQSGFGETLDHLQSNPLPDSLLLQPSEALDTLALKTLLAELNSIPQVDQASLDTQWLERLFALLHIAQRIILIISLLFSLAVLLIIGNTIRLDINNRQQEIIVTKLIGATNSFIRRPFLYSGLLYGLFGGFLSWLLLEISLLFLLPAMNRLSSLYPGNMQFITLSFSDFMLLLMVSTGLGLCGSWIAVARHLSKIEPT